MSKVVVHTEFLRGYADLMETACDEPRGKLRRYIGRHCANKDGMDGWLTAGESFVDKVAQNSTNHVDNVASGLTATAEALDRAADFYDRSDNEGAKWIFSAVAESVPDDYQETDPAIHDAPAFPPALSVELPAPKQVKKAEKYREQFQKDLKDINDWIKATTGFDLEAALLKVVVPEWGCLDRIGEAYAHGHNWYVDFIDHVDKGMDTLAPHWTDGDASEAFQYHIRVAWNRHLEYRIAYLALTSDYFPYVSTCIDAVVATLADFVAKFTPVIKNAIDAAKSLDAPDFWQAARDIAEMVGHLINLTRVALKFLDKFIGLLDEAFVVLVDSLEVGAGQAADAHVPPNIPDPGPRRPANSKIVPR